MIGQQGPLSLSAVVHHHAPTSVTVKSAAARLRGIEEVSRTVRLVVPNLRVVERVRAGPAAPGDGVPRPVLASVRIRQGDARVALSPGAPDIFLALLHGFDVLARRLKRFRTRGREIRRPERGKRRRQHSRGINRPSRRAISPRYGRGMRRPSRWAIRRWCGRRRFRCRRRGVDADVVSWAVCVAKHTLAAALPVVIVTRDDETAWLIGAALAVGDRKVGEEGENRHYVRSRRK